ncbi:MAG: tetraacyldisaccharide 4'-kinase [Muribaculaceae bacterium]|nr:tetraacyldisaccharide 4'-kinase [Muribaculaceae bacterium]
MTKNKVISALVLLPLSKLYGFGVGVRNLMFKWGILRQREFPVPVIVVGNIGVGGTGKTPHTEYIVNLLRYKYRVAMLSRGYKRTTKGFVLATRRSTPLDIGDEPYQIYHKFGGDVTVAVCEDRCAGIDELLRLDPKINLVVLDDAFQHRYVKPSVSVVLTEFNNPVFYDKLLPLGRLREPVSAIYRADVVVVSKCPDQLQPLEYAIFKKNLKLFPYQKLFFSRYSYGSLRPLFPDQFKDTLHLSWLGEEDTVLALSGIANPKPFIRYLKSFRPKVKVKLFPDHHNFSRKDLDALVRRFDEIEGKRRIIVTTEKDAVRLINNPYFPESLKSCIYYQPIEVQFDPMNVSNFDMELQKALLNSIR